MIHPNDTLLQKKMRHSQSDHLVKALSWLCAPCEECSGGLGATVDSAAGSTAIAPSVGNCKPLALKTGQGCDLCQMMPFLQQLRARRATGWLSHLWWVVLSEHSFLANDTMPHDGAVLRIT